MVVDKHKFIFIHVPKTAGSSISRVIIRATKLPAELLRPNGYGTGPGILGWKRHFFPPPLPSGSKYPYDDYTTFTSVRNPFIRAVSTYRFWSTSWKPGVPRYKSAFLPECHSIFNSFEEWVKHYKYPSPESVFNYTLPEHPGECVHGMSQSEFLLQRTGKLDNIDHILKVENLHNDWKTIQKNIPVLSKRRVIHINRSKDKHGKRQYNYKNYYTSPKLVDIISHDFIDDIKNFNYTYDG